MNTIQKALGILLIAFSSVLLYIGVQNTAECVGLLYLLFVTFSPVGVLTGIWALKE